MVRSLRSNTLDRGWDPEDIGDPLDPGNGSVLLGGKFDRDLSEQSANVKYYCCNRLSERWKICFKRVTVYLTNDKVY